jgi:hypothetical protein
MWEPRHLTNLRASTVFRNEWIYLPFNHENAHIPPKKHKEYISNSDVDKKLPTLEESFFSVVQTQQAQQPYYSVGPEFAVSRWRNGEWYTSAWGKVTQWLLIRGAGLWEVQGYVDLRNLSGCTYIYLYKNIYLIQYYVNAFNMEPVL